MTCVIVKILIYAIIKEIIRAKQIKSEFEEEYYAEHQWY